MAKAWVLFWKDGKREVIFGDTLPEAYKTKHHHINMTLLTTYVEAHVIVMRGIAASTIFYCFKEKNIEPFYVIDIIASAGCEKYESMKGKRYDDRSAFNLDYRRLGVPESLQPSKLSNLKGVMS